MAAGPCSDCDALNANKLAGPVRLILDFKAKGYGLSDTLGRRGEGASLGVAAWKLKSAGHVITSLAVRRSRLKHAGTLIRCMSQASARKWWRTTQADPQPGQRAHNTKSTP